MTRPDYGTVVCAVCGESAKKNGPRQATCGKPVCKTTLQSRRKAESLARRVERRLAQKQGQPVPAAAAMRREVRAPMANGPLAWAFAHVRADIEQADERHGRDIKTLGQRVRWVVDGVRTKDRQAYEAALTRLAGWALQELAAVRSTGDASGS